MKRTPPPPPIPGQIWIEMRVHPLHPGDYQKTGRELWIRAIGDPARHFGQPRNTVKADSVRGAKVRRVEIYADRVRPPRWRLVLGLVAGPIPTSRQRLQRKDWRAQVVMPLRAT